jgi:hypothetical protein
MAGTPLVGSAQVIYQEDVDVNSIVSEATQTKIAKAALYAQDNTEFPVIFDYQGFFRTTQVTNGAGSFVCTKRYEITKYVLSLADTDGGAYNTLNANVYDSDGSLVGLLFDTNSEPAIQGTSTIFNRYAGKDIVANTDILSSTTNMNFRTGTINLTTLEDGYIIRPFITSNGTNSKNISLTLYLRGLE